MDADAHYWDDDIRELDKLAKSIFLSAYQRRRVAEIRDCKLATKKLKAKNAAYFWGRRMNALHRSQGILYYDAPCDYFIDRRPNGSKVWVR